VNDILGFLIGEVRLRPPYEERHRFAHVVDAIAPAVFVALHRSHPGLEAVAGHAMDEEQVLAALLRQKLDALVHRDISPAHVARLQGKVVRGVLVRRERHGIDRVGLIARRLDLHPIVAGRQVLDPVAALIVREHVERDLGLGTAGLHEGATERLPVRAFDRAGDSRGISGRDRERDETDHSDGS
jgi:hypothetical protein